MGNGDVPETIETNNTKASGAVKIGPDLSITALTVPATAGAGYSIAINDTANNATGVSPAPASTTYYYLSTDNKLDAGDPMIGQRPVAALAPGSSDSSVAWPVMIPSGTAAGNYYLIAVADGPNAIFETNENNNCVASQTSVVVTRPDLVETSVSDPPATATPGASFQVSDTTQNSGTVSAGASTTRYYLSPDAAQGNDKLLTGTRPVGTLAAGAPSSGTVTVTIPGTTAAGSYFLLACADDTKAVIETNETNNCKASAGKVTVGP